MASSQLRKRNFAKPAPSNDADHVKGARNTASYVKIFLIVILLPMIGILSYSFLYKSANRLPSQGKRKEAVSLFSADNDNHYSPQDKLIAKHLRRGFSLLDRNSVSKAVNHFEKTLTKYPYSPVAHYGLGASLDKLADEKRSNVLLQNAVDSYVAAAKSKECPISLALAAMSRATGRLNFLGKNSAAVKIAREIAAIFPGDSPMLNKLGVQWLMVGQNDKAKEVFQKSLQLDPSSGFAKSHLAFALKSELKYNESILLFEEGIHSDEEGADDGKFYFHLGDAYTRTGRREEAHRVYAEGAEKGHFMSALQRSLYNADTPLKAQPWWDPSATPYTKSFKKLEENWKTIREEGLALLDTKTGGFQAEEENLRETGDWLQFTLYQRGKKVVENCRKAPKTCALLDAIPDASGCTRGQVKYSVMHPGTHIWPHCGPTNCRIRSHLGLVIPSDVHIRCGEETRTWEEGKVIIIDDSFDHEVWHNGTSFRLIFIVDFWHPDLTKQQRNSLSPI